VSVARRRRFTSRTIGKKDVLLAVSFRFDADGNRKPVKSMKNAFARAVDVAGLNLTDGNVTPYTLRHTAATSLVQRAVGHGRPQDLWTCP
jgi:integrase